MRNEKQICCEFRYFHHVPGATDPQVAAARGGGRVTGTGHMAECLLYPAVLSPLPLCIHLYPSELVLLIKITQRSCTLS